MKLTILLLTVGFLNVSASGFSQKINYYGKNVSLESVFSTIQKETGYLFMYKDGELDNAALITIKATNESIEDFLERLFLNQPFDYSVSGKSIFVSRRPANPAGPLSMPAEEYLKLMQIQLTVIDEEFKPLSGASVEVTGSKKMHLTGAKGSLSLSVQENSIIKVTYVGYINQEVKVTTAHLSSNSILVIMKRSDKSLDETQIIAYGKTTKRFATGSIGTIKAEEIERQPVMNVLQVLEGKVPGLVITPISGNSAAPVKVEIRGRNSLNPNALSEPLYVVDGMPLSTLQVSMFYGKGVSTGSVQAGRTNTGGESPLLYLNPRDIESIDVLKDGDATAIYGARGANGVILITTKKSKSGPTQFNITIEKGSITIPKKLDLLETEEYLAVRREAFKNDGTTPTISNAPDLMQWDQTKYTDWQAYFYKPGGQTTVNASVSGGMDQTNYRIAANYYEQDVLNNNGGKNQRGTLTGNITHTSTNQKFQFDFSSMLSIRNVVAIPATSRFTLTPPNAPDVYNELGEFNFEPYRGQLNSLFPFGDLKRHSDSRVNDITNRLGLRYEVIKGLNVSVAGLFRFEGNNNATYEPLAASDPNFPQQAPTFFGRSTSTNWLVEPQISYNTFIGKGNLSVQVGGSLQHSNVESMTTLAFGFSDDNLMRSPNNAAFSSSIEESGEYKFNAAFGIINYRWDNKYVLNLTGRRDGSSRFGPGKQFGNFGSVGLAWIASEEKWMKRVMPSWFSFLKFFGSYANTGSDAVGDYEYLTRWGTATSLGSFDKMLDYNGTPSMHLLAHTNPDFRWESTNEFNASVSIGLFEDKINMEASYYQARSGNQLSEIGTPLYTGHSTVRANWNAVVENSGLEFSLSAKFLNSKGWRASGGFNIGMNKNKLVDFPGLQYSPYSNLYEVGRSMRTMYLFKYTGINTMTGDYTFEDHNKDGVLSFPNGDLKKLPTDDRYIVYDLNDGFNGGMNLNISYKSFGLDAKFVFKKAIVRDPYINLNVGSMSNLYIPQEVKDNHWKQPGDIAKYPKYTTGSLDNARLLYSDAGYKDASFFQMNNLYLSYDFPANLINKIKMKGCRLSVSTQNIFTITNFKGIDPRINSMVGGSPTPRVISSTLSFNF